MEKQQAEKAAQIIVKSVVDLLSQKRYEELTSVVDMENLTVDEVKELVEGYLELNGLTHIDSFDTKCNFSPSYEFHQMEFYYNDCDNGFEMDYALTTDEELNDLTLQMEFNYDGEGALRAKLSDLQVL